MSALSELPNSARLWIFPLKAALGNEQQMALSAELSTFMRLWVAHKQKVYGAFELRDNQFILVAANTTLQEVSGCSIDSLFSNISQAATLIGADLAGNDTIFYQIQNKAKSATREEFRALVQSGAITSNTSVYDNTIQTLKELPNWVLPFEKAWHAKAFQKLPV